MAHSEETKIAVLETKVDNLTEKVDNLTKAAEAINEKLDDKYATKEEVKAFHDEFIFWRNILISGLILSIFTALIINYVIK